MSYYDPKIYNYKNLSYSEQDIIDMIIVSTANMFEAIDDSENIASVSPILSRICKEISATSIAKAKIGIINNMVEMIVHFIDSHKNEVQTIETEDHFFGLPEDLKNMLFDSYEDEHIKLDFGTQNSFGCGNLN